MRASLFLVFAYVAGKAEAAQITPLRTDTCGDRQIATTKAQCEAAASGYSGYTFEELDHTYTVANREKRPAGCFIDTQVEEVIWNPRSAATRACYDGVDHNGNPSAYFMSQTVLGVRHSGGCSQWGSDYDVACVCEAGEDYDGFDVNDDKICKRDFTNADCDSSTATTGVWTFETFHNPMNVGDSILDKCIKTATNDDCDTGFTFDTSQNPINAADGFNLEHCSKTYLDANCVSPLNKYDGTVHKQSDEKTQTEFLAAHCFQTVTSAELLEKLSCGDDVSSLHHGTALCNN